MNAFRRPPKVHQRILKSTVAGALAIIYSSLKLFSQSQLSPNSQGLLQARKNKQSKHMRCFESSLSQLLLPFSGNRTLPHPLYSSRPFSQNSKAFDNCSETKQKIAQPSRRRSTTSSLSSSLAFSSPAQRYDVYNLSNYLFIESTQQLGTAATSEREKNQS